MITKGYVDFFHRHRYQYLWFFIMYACFWFWCVQSVILWLTLQFVNCVYIYILYYVVISILWMEFLLLWTTLMSMINHFTLLSSAYSYQIPTVLCDMCDYPVDYFYHHYHQIYPITTGTKIMNSDIYMASKTAVGKTACACCVNCRFTDFVFEGLWVPKASQKYKSNFVNLNKNTEFSYNNYMFENNKRYL